MDTNTIIDELTRERDRISAAIEALTGTNRVHLVRSTTKIDGRKKSRKMSPEVKRRLSIAAKARWAKAKKEGKNAL